MWGLNKTATITRPTKAHRPGGDVTQVDDPTVATGVACTLQENMGAQQLLPGGQVTIRKSRLWFAAGADVEENDFITLSDGSTWRVEHVFDDAGRGHHLVCEVKRFT